MIKRAFDLTFACLALIVTAPVMAAVALAIRCDSRGPIIFRQQRVGRHGVTFRIHKFRTMADDDAGPPVSTSNDARVTRVGRLLRRTKVDELPQLFDVLRGDMSVVGPRPEVPQYVAAWPAELRELILSVRPGITDPASVTYRNEGDLLAGAADPEAYYVDVLLPQKTALYAEYVRHQSLLLDLRILLQTAGAVLFH